MSKTFAIYSYLGDFGNLLVTSRIASNWGRHCSRFLRPMWRNERRSFSLTWGCRSLRGERSSKLLFWLCGCYLETVSYLFQNVWIQLWHYGTPRPRVIGSAWKRRTIKMKTGHHLAKLFSVIGTISWYSMAANVWGEHSFHSREEGFQAHESIWSAWEQMPKEEIRDLMGQLWLSVQVIFQKVSFHS